MLCHSATNLFLNFPFWEKLTQDAVQQEPNDGDCRYQEEQQAADEDRCLPAGFLRWLRDAKRVDEGIGQEVEQGHVLLCAKRCRCA